MKPLTKQSPRRLKILLWAIGLSILLLLILMMTVWREDNPDPAEYPGQPGVQELLQK
jgi:hypothetical protein